MSNDRTGMNNERLDVLIREVGEDIRGELGFWEFSYRGRRLCCMTDESHDRMRVMTPIADLDDVTQGQLQTCLEANFDRALDARYCVNDTTLWGAFIPPAGIATRELVSIRMSTGCAYRGYIRRRIFQR